MKKILAFSLSATMILCLFSCSSGEVKNKDIRVKRSDNKTEREVEEDTEESSETEQVHTQSAVTETSEAKEETSTEETSAETVKETETFETSESSSTSGSNDPETLSSDYISYRLDHLFDSKVNVVEKDDGTTESYGAGYVFQSLQITDNRYPELQKQIKAFQDEHEELTKARYEDMYNGACDAATGDDPYYYMAVNSSANYLVRSDNKVFSFEVNDQIYSGGVHGDYMYIGYNFDSKTGKQLLLSDVSSDPEQVIDNSLSFLAANKDYIGLFDDYEETIKNIDIDKINFVMYVDGLELIFNPYEIAPYVAGDIRVFVEYEENALILNEEYWTGLPSNRFINFYQYDDFDGNGNLGFEFMRGSDYYAVITNGMDDEYQYSNGVTIIVNEEAINFDPGKFYVVSPFFAEKDGKSYIVIHIQTADSDKMYLFDVTSGKTAENLGFANGMPETMIDPDNFIATVGIDLFDDIYGRTSFKIDDIGQIVQISDKYDLWISTKELATDIKGKLVTDGKAGEEITLKAGDEVAPYVYDGTDSTLDLLTNDGRIIRTETEVSTEGRKVAGIDVEDLFEKTEDIY